MFGNHGLCGLLEEGAHGKSPKCLDGNLGDFGEFCKGLSPQTHFLNISQPPLGGCVLKRHLEVKPDIKMDPAAFRRLCVETCDSSKEQPQKTISRLQAAEC